MRWSPPKLNGFFYQMCELTDSELHCHYYWVWSCMRITACLHGGGGPQIGEVTIVAGHPTYHVNVIK